MALGAAVFVGLALLSNTTIGDAIDALKQGLELFRLVQSESVGHRLVRYAFGFGEQLGVALFEFSLPLLALIVFIATRRLAFAIGGLAALLLVLLIRGHLIGGWENGASFAPPAAIYAMLVMALIVSFPIWGRNRNSFALVLGLVLLPYTVGIGTGNALFTQIVVSLAPWAVLIGLLIVAHPAKDFRKMPVTLVGFSFISTVALQTGTSGFRPYHLSAPIFEQDQTFVSEGLGSIKVDAGTHKFLTDAKAAAQSCGIGPASPFLGLYNIPGVALALQAVPIMTPWITNLGQANFVIERLDPHSRQSAVLALNLGNTKELPPLPDALKGFPTGYQYCGSATYPYGDQEIQIWRPSGGT
jgi:hypothetical protein